MNAYFIPENKTYIVAGYTSQNRENRAKHTVQQKLFLFAIIRAIRKGSGGIGKMNASVNAQRHNINTDILLYSPGLKIE